jgi:ABC-type sugar transport system substrate-binding protein
MRRFMAFTAAVVVAAGVAACGGDDSGSGAAASPSTGAATQTTGQPTSSPASGDRAKRAKTAAAAAVDKAGGPVTVPKAKTVAYLDLLGVAELSVVQRSAVERAAKAFGWELLKFDAGGKPDQAAANIQTAVNRGADAIIGVATAPALLTQGLKAAQAKGIPYFSITNPVQPMPTVAAQYTWDLPAGVAMLAEAMRSAVPSGSQVGIFETPLLYGYQAAVAEFKKAADENEWDIAQDTQIDVADFENTTRRGMNALLSTHPQVKGVLIDISIGFQVAAQVLKVRGKCGTVGLFTFGDDNSKLTEKALADGCGTAVASYSQLAAPLAAVDQIAEFFARKKELADIPKDDAALTDLYGLNLLAPQIVTKDKLEQTGGYPESIEDVQTFFATKWAKEFNVRLPQ